MVCQPQECMIYSLKEDNLKPETRLDTLVGIYQTSKDCIFQIMAGHTQGTFYTQGVDGFCWPHMPPVGECGYKPEFIYLSMNRY